PDYLASKSAGGITALNMMDLFNKGKEFVMAGCLAFDYTAPDMTLGSVFKFSTLNTSYGIYDGTTESAPYNELPLTLEIETLFDFTNNTKYPMPKWILRRNSQTIADSNGFRAAGIEAYDKGDPAQTFIIKIKDGQKYANDYELMLPVDAP